MPVCCLISDLSIIPILFSLEIPWNYVALSIDLCARYDRSSSTLQDVLGEMVVMQFLRRPHSRKVRKCSETVQAVLTTRMSLDLPEDPLPTAEHGEHSLDDRGTGGGEDTVPPRRSSSPTVDPPTWQAQLTAARAEIAHRVQKQLEDDGWDTSEPTRDVAEMTMPRTQHSADRRASIATDDGDEDLLIAEMLRPRSRPRTPAEEEPTSCDDPVTSDSAPSRSAGDTTSDKICRICFDSEDDALGRLFSPCRCRGSVRFLSPSLETQCDTPLGR